MNLETFTAFEQPLKRVATVLGVASVVAIVQDWQFAAMCLSLPFCLIWMYCGWLRTEPQLKNINMLFAALYVYGITRSLMMS